MNKKLKILIFKVTEEMKCGNFVLDDCLFGQVSEKISKISERECYMQCKHVFGEGNQEKFTFVNDLTKLVFVCKI